MKTISELWADCKTNFEAKLFKQTLEVLVEMSARENELECADIDVGDICFKEHEVVKALEARVKLDDVTEAQLEETLQCIELILTKYPRYSNIIRIQTHLKQKKYTEALDAINILIEADEHNRLPNEELFELRSEIYYQSGQLEGAIEDLKALIYFQGGVLASLYQEKILPYCMQLAKIYFEQNDFVNSLTYLNEIFKDEYYEISQDRRCLDAYILRYKINLIQGNEEAAAIDEHIIHRIKPINGFTDDSLQSFCKAAIFQKSPEIKKILDKTLFKSPLSILRIYHALDRADINEKTLSNIRKSLYKTSKHNYTFFEALKKLEKRSLKYDEIINSNLKSVGIKRTRTDSSLEMRIVHTTYIDGKSRDNPCFFPLQQAKNKESATKIAKTCTMI